MLDVGAGSGGFSIGVVGSHPEMRVTAADLAQVIPVTRRFLEEAALADRVATLAVDVVTSAPAGIYDAAVMRNLIQVLSLEKAQAAVRNVAKSLAPGGALFVVGGMIDDTRQTPADKVGQNLVMLNIYDEGLNYSESEYCALLVDAGFEAIDVRKGAMPGASALICARKPG